MEEVTIFSDDLFESSCLWLEKNKIIKPEHCSVLMECKERHDSITHGFNEILFQDFTDGIAVDFNALQRTGIEIQPQEFEKMIDLLHRVEAWRAAVDYGLSYGSDEDELETIFPVAAVGMMRIANLAFPKDAEGTFQ